MVSRQLHKYTRHVPTTCDGTPHAAQAHTNVHDQVKRDRQHLVAITDWPCRAHANATELPREASQLHTPGPATSAVEPLLERLHRLVGHTVIVTG